jgi:hypothetical protein
VYFARAIYKRLRPLAAPRRQIPFDSLGTALALAGASQSAPEVIHLLAIYIAALIIGGALVAASMFLGGDDTDTDSDTDADADAHDHDFAGAGSWLPLASLRFWTFLLAFGGLAGTVLTLLGTDVAVTAVASVLTGYLSGVGVRQVMKRLQRDQVSSEVDLGECVGALGKLTLPVSRVAPGKVRVRIKGRDLDLMASTDDAADIPLDAEVLVYEVRDDGVVLVTAHSTAAP